MRVSGHFLFGLFMIWHPTAVVAGSSKSITPPGLYVDKGACPFECCTYQAWKVIKVTDVFDKPDGKKIGSLKPGSKIDAMTGNVYVVPTLAKVAFSFTDEKGRQFCVDDNVYMMTYLGEGFHRIWFKGEVFDEDVSFIYNALSSDRECKTPSADCWLRIVRDNRKKGTWWVKLEMPSGKVGWAEVNHNFDPMDMDRCS